MSKSATFWLALCLFVACLAFNAVFDYDVPAPAPRVKNDVTFETVKPIFESRCSRCHSGPQDWTKHEIAKEKAQTIKQRVWLFKNMPPQPNEMTVEERRLVRDWVDGGAL